MRVTMKGNQHITNAANAAYSARKLWCLMYLMQRLSERIETFSSEQLSCRQEVQEKNKMRE